MSDTHKNPEFNTQSGVEAGCQVDDIQFSTKTSSERETMKFLNTVPYTSLFVGALVLFSLGFFIGRFSNPQQTKTIALDSRPIAAQQVLFEKNEACEAQMMRPQGMQLTVASLAEREQ